MFPPKPNHFKMFPKSYGGSLKEAEALLKKVRVLNNIMTNKRNAYIGLWLNE